MSDESIEGSFVVIENPTIKEKKSMYKEGIEHRFIKNPEGRFKSDFIIMKIFNKNNKWRSISDIMDETGLAERTTHYACRRFVRHTIFEEKTAIELGVRKKHPYHPRARLYRLKSNKKDDARRNKKKV